MGTAAFMEPKGEGRRRWPQMLRKLAGISLDLALPPLCPACKDPVGAQAALCASCWSKLAFISPPFCDRLGTPFAYDPGPGMLSMQAIADPPAYGRARAAVRYDDVSRILVHGLKYSDRLDLAPMLGRWMARAGHALLQDADALVPVPLHWRRLGSPVQSIGRAGQGHFSSERHPGPRQRAQAGEADGSAGGPDCFRARAQCPRSVCGAGPFERRRQDADPDRRRADSGGDDRALR